MRTRGDPLEWFNRPMFAVFRAVDKLLVRPASVIYRKVIPKPIRSGLRNVFRNLTEPMVFVNDLLQLKPKRAGETLARFTINSTLGVGGILDVAAHEKIPYRGNSFGNTLGYYGVGPGPYLVVPIFGPITFRDAAAEPADGLLLPQLLGSPFTRTDFQISTAAVDGLDQRVEHDQELKSLLGGALDPYATMRSAYLQHRAAEIEELKGGKRDATPAPEELEDPLVDPAQQAAPEAAPDTAPPAAAPGPAEQDTPLPAVPADPAAPSPSPEAAPSTLN